MFGRWSVPFLQVLLLLVWERIPEWTESFSARAGAPSLRLCCIVFFSKFLQNKMLFISSLHLPSPPKSQNAACLSTKNHGFVCWALNVKKMKSNSFHYCWWFRNPTNQLKVVGIHISVHNRISWGVLEKPPILGKGYRCLTPKIPIQAARKEEGLLWLLTVTWVIQVAKDVVEIFLVTGSPHLEININCGWMSNPCPFNWGIPRKVMICEPKIGRTPPVF